MPRQGTTGAMPICCLLTPLARLPRHWCPGTVREGGNTATGLSQRHGDVHTPAAHSFLQKHLLSIHLLDLTTQSPSVKAPDLLEQDTKIQVGWYLSTDYDEVQLLFSVPC